MTYQNFIDHINEKYGLDKSYQDLENLIAHGISWCESGEAEDGEKTTLCASCQHYKDCDAIYDMFSVTSRALSLAADIKASAEWDHDQLKELCALAGISDEWEAADGESFEAIAYKAAEILGVEIV